MMRRSSRMRHLGTRHAGHGVVHEENVNPAVIAAFSQEVQR